MKNIAGALALLVCVIGNVNAQGVLATLYHLVRIDYVLEEQRALKFAKPTDMTLPKYDFDLIRAGIEGSTTVRFRIDGEGRVVELTTVHQSQREFGEAALEAVAKWRFVPLAKTGAKFSGRIECKFSFVCHDEK